MAKDTLHAHYKTIDVPETMQPAKTQLGISPEKVCFIIVKAREWDVKVPPVESDPGSNPADMQQREILEDYDSDPTRQELRDAIIGLNNDEKADLVALMWLGRGDFEVTEWARARGQAIEEQHHVARYLMGTPLLGDHLENGLSAMGYSCEEFEINRL